MKRIYFYVSFLSCLLASQTGLAQEKEDYKLSLKQAVVLAIKNNKYVKNAGLKIAAAKEKKWETTAVGLPQVNAKVEYLNGVVQQFPGMDFNGDGIIDIGAKHSLTPSVTLSQLIFDGSYIVGLQAAKVFLEISKNSETKTKNKIETETTMAYANALLINESIVLTKQNKTSLEKNLNETREIFNNGLLEQESVEQLELTLANLDNNLNRLEQLKKNAYNALKFLFSIDFKCKLVLTDTLETIYTADKAENLVKESSYFESIDIKIAQNNVKAKALLHKLEKSKLLPSISAFVNANYIANNKKFTTLISSNQKYVNTVNFGVSMRIPVFSSFGNRSKIRNAKINHQIAENELLLTTSSIQIEIENAKTELEFAYNNYKNKKKSLALANKIERKNVLKFKEGISTSFDLRQAQTQLYSIQQEYLQSIATIINKKTTLQNLYK